MANTKGDGRLDRIEKIVGNLARAQRRAAIIQNNDHDRFQAEQQKLLTWQVLTQDKMDRKRERLDALN